MTQSTVSMDLPFDELRALIRARLMGLDAGPPVDLHAGESPEDWVIASYRHGAQAVRHRIEDILDESLRELGAVETWPPAAATSLCSTIQRCGGNLLDPVRRMVTGRSLVRTEGDAAHRRERRARHCMLLKVLVGHRSRETPEFWVTQWEMLGDDVAALTFVALHEHGAELAFSYLPRLVSNPEVAHDICHAFPNLVHEHGLEAVRGWFSEVAPLLPAERRDVFLREQSEFLAGLAFPSGAEEEAARSSDGTPVLVPSIRALAPFDSNAEKQLTVAEANRRLLQTIIDRGLSSAGGFVVFVVELGRMGKGAFVPTKDADLLRGVDAALAEWTRGQDRSCWLGGSRFAFLLTRVTGGRLRRIVRRVGENLVSLVDEAEAPALAWRHGSVEVASDERFAPAGVLDLAIAELEAADWTPVLDFGETSAANVAHVDLLRTMTVSMIGLRRLANQHPGRFHRVPIKRFLRVYADLLAQMEETYARDEDVSREEVTEALAIAMQRIQKELRPVTAEDEGSPSASPPE